MAPKNWKTKIGSLGEAIALDYLVKKNYQLVAKNWRFKRWEVDLILSRANRLHFVEVKTRTTLSFGYPEQSVSQSKMNFLKNAAEGFLALHPLWTNIQFDVVSVFIQSKQPIRIDFFEDIYF